MFLKYQLYQHYEHIQAQNIQYTETILLTSVLSNKSMHEEGKFQY